MSDIDNSIPSTSVKWSHPVSWSRQQTLTLIRELRNNPCLWNPLDSNFSNKEKRKEKLNGILNEILKVKNTETIQGIKKKIKTLHSQIFKEKNKILNAKESGDEYTPILWCFNDLSFLFNCNDEENKTTSTLDLEKVGIGEVEPEEETLEVNPPKIRKINLSKQLQKKYSNSVGIGEVEPEEETLEVNPPKKRKINLSKQLQKKDSNSVEFCRYLGCELSKIKLEVNFDEVKLEILQLVTKTIREERTMLQDQTYFKPIQNPRYAIHEVNIPKPQKNKNILDMAVNNLFEDLIEEDPFYELCDENEL